MSWWEGAEGGPLTWRHAVRRGCHVHGRLPRTHGVHAGLDGHPHGYATLDGHAVHWNSACRTGHTNAHNPHHTQLTHLIPGITCVECTSLPRYPAAKDTRRPTTASSELCISSHSTCGCKSARAMACPMLQPWAAEAGRGAQSLGANAWCTRDVHKITLERDEHQQQHAISSRWGGAGGTWRSRGNPWQTTVAMWRVLHGGAVAQASAAHGLQGAAAIVPYLTATACCGARPRVSASAS